MKLHRNSDINSTYQFVLSIESLRVPQHLIYFFQVPVLHLTELLHSVIEVYVIVRHSRAHHALLLVRLHRLFLALGAHEGLCLLC